MTAATRTDPYPTRRTPVSTIGPRLDPVVYGRAEAGPLDGDALRSYEEAGFLVLPGLLRPDELDPLRAELLRLRTTDLGPDAHLVTEPGSGEVRSIFAVHRLSEVFAALFADPRLVGPARQILGGDVYIHQSRANYKPGFHGRDFYWHSDFETWHAEDGMPRMRALSVSIALTDNLDVNGPLMLMPGSHRTFVTGVGSTPAENYKRSLKVQVVGLPDEAALTRLAGEHGITPVVGPAGTAVAFDCNCIHGSNGNITPFPRSNLFVVYNSVDNALGEPYAATAPRPEFLAARDATPVGR